ncbi:MAG: hypothetical protein NUW37_20325 [Planctomycetes bacterium]|nr:hypothetical protein [Planctomycetota bacterium]
MEHDRLSHLMSGALDGELTYAEREDLYEILKAVPVLEEEYFALMRQTEAIRDLPMLKAPPGIRDGVMNNIERNPREVAASFKSLPKRKTRGPFLQAAAVFGLAITLGVYVASDAILDRGSSSEVATSQTGPEPKDSTSIRVADQNQIARFGVEDSFAERENVLLAAPTIEDEPPTSGSGEGGSPPIEAPRPTPNVWGSNDPAPITSNSNAVRNGVADEATSDEDDVTLSRENSDAGPGAPAASDNPAAAEDSQRRSGSQVGRRPRISGGSPDGAPGMPHDPTSQGPTLQGPPPPPQTLQELMQMLQDARDFYLGQNPQPGPQPDPQGEVVQNDPAPGDQQAPPPAEPGPGLRSIIEQLLGGQNPNAQVPGGAGGDSTVRDGNIADSMRNLQTQQQEARQSEETVRVEPNAERTEARSELGQPGGQSGSVQMQPSAPPATTRTPSMTPPAVTQPPASVPAQAAPAAPTSPTPPTTFAAEPTPEVTARSAEDRNTDNDVTALGEDARESEANVGARGLENGINDNLGAASGGQPQEAAGTVDSGVSRITRQQGTRQQGGRSGPAAERSETAESTGSSTTAGERRARTQNELEANRNRARERQVDFQVNDFSELKELLFEFAIAPKEENDEEIVYELSLQERAFVVEALVAHGYIDETSADDFLEGVGDIFVGEGPHNAESPENESEESDTFTLRLRKK